MNKKNIGFTIGKFAPLHKGHQFLIETALKEMNEFIVVIYETDHINIPVEVRANWIKTLYPQIKIIYAMNPPKKYGLDEESVKIQMEYLTEIIGDMNPTHFYSSEPYGKYVAAFLNIIDRRVDTEKKVVPISATKIRSHVDENKDWINEIVYHDLKKYTRKSKEE